MRYKLTSLDFHTAFDFALRYHLDPKKSQASRTSGATRGLGDVLDSFLLGKLVEIGVVQILKTINPDKEYLLDLEIKENAKILNEPDIIEVVENGKKRNHRCFVEIKNISKDDRWVGLTTEQFETIKKASKDSQAENVYIIGAYIESSGGSHAKQKDVLGSFLKALVPSGKFDAFADMDTYEVVIDYAISGKELEEHGMEFMKGSIMYETEVFEVAGDLVQKNIQNSKYKSLGKFSSGVLERYAMNLAYPEPNFMGDFHFDGDIEIYEKTNEKSLRRYIYCITDVVVTSNVLGIFQLEKGKTYLFNLTTIGRNPALNRNNIWIAKRNIPSLQASNKILSTQIQLEQIASLI